MKLFRIAVCAALLVLTIGSFGQTSPGDLVVDVPFAFSVAGKIFPAGHYIVAQQINMIKIFNPQTQAVYVPTHPAVRPKTVGSKLVFHRYGDSYFLSAVWITGNNSGKELFPSASEREIEARHAEMEMAVVRPGQ